MINFVVVPAAIVPVVRHTVVNIREAAQLLLIATQPFLVALLEPPARQAPLLLQLAFPLGPKALLI